MCCRFSVLPLVCKRWRHLTQGPSPVWDTVVVEPPIVASAHKIHHDAVIRWVANRAKAIRELRLRLFDYKETHDFAPGNFAQLFQVLAHKLKGLHVLKCGHVLKPEAFGTMSVLAGLETLSIRSWDEGDEGVPAAAFGWITALQCLSSVTLEMELIGFPEALAQLTNLREINLHKCRCLELPACVSDLKVLKSLSMLDCSMQRLSPSVCGLRSLEVLNVGMNELGQLHDESLPQQLSALTKLRQLALCCCKYDSVPPIISVMTSLQVCLCACLVYSFFLDFSGVFFDSTNKCNIIIA